MELTSTQTLPVSQAEAWQALNDIALLQTCIPGCEGIDAIGENEYEVLVTAAIGPVKAKFKGKLKLENLQPPQSYTLRFEGQGGPAGHGKGSAEVRLEATEPRITTLHYSATASVGGKLAQIGSRLVDMAAQKMAGEFFASFEQKLRERYPEAALAAPAPAEPQGLLARFLAWIRRLFGG